MEFARSSLAISVVFIATACTEAQRDVSGDVAAIKAANEYYIGLHPGGDVDALMDIYADGVMLMPPGGGTVEGKAEVRRMWEGFFEEWTVLEAESTLNEVIVLGDWAYGRGEFVETYRSNETDATIIDRGTFSGLWQRQLDGGWKIARDSWSSSIPPE